MTNQVTLTEASHTMVEQNFTFPTSANESTQPFNFAQATQKPQLIYYMWQNVVGMPEAKMITTSRYNNEESDAVRGCSLGCMLLPSAGDMLSPGLTYPNPFVDF